MKKTIDKLNKWIDRIDKEADADNNIFRAMNGFDFSLFVQNLLIEDEHYVCDTGNWENVNYACACHLLNRIEKHPLIWKLFFRI